MDLKQIIPFIEEHKNEIKLHCAIGRKDKFEPKFFYLNGKFKAWQERQTKKNFERKYILSIVYLDKNEWLFCGIYERLSVKMIGKDNYCYQTRCMDIASEFIGKLVIGFKKDFRASYLRMERHINNLKVLEIKRDIIFPIFPGYDKVNVSWLELAELIETESWKTALENQKGIYLITDSDNGKMYVGGSYGDDMLLGRWRDYVNNGHGGNKKLKDLSFEHIKQYFRYSI